MCRLVKFFILALLLIACDDVNRPQKARLLYMDFTSSHAGVGQYTHVYRSAKDSLNNWISEKLSVSKMQRYSKWELDSLLCFNTNQDKVVMAVVNQESATVNNSVNIFYGVKINDEWLFFYGPTIYPDPLNHTPLSFGKLHEIAVREVFGGYLRRQDRGLWARLFGKTEYEVNEAFFADFTGGAYGGRAPKTQAQWDSVYLQVVKNNWSVRDTTRYDPQK